MARGWPTERAVAFVRRPDTARIAALENGAHGCPPLRSWLSPRPRPSPTCIPTDAPPGCGGANPSPYTQAILDRVGGVVAAARRLGLDLCEGHQPCPWHRSRGARSLQVTGSLWRCHAGCGSGNAIHLVAKALTVSYREARNDLAARLGISWRRATSGREEGGGVKRSCHRERGRSAHRYNEAGGPGRAERSAHA